MLHFDVVIIHLHEWSDAYTDVFHFESNLLILREEYGSSVLFGNDAQQLADTVNFIK